MAVSSQSGLGRDEDNIAGDNVTAVVVDNGEPGPAEERLRGGDPRGGGRGLPHPRLRPRHGLQLREQSQWRILRGYSDQLSGDQNLEHRAM